MFFHVCCLWNSVVVMPIAVTLLVTMANPLLSGAWGEDFNYLHLVVQYQRQIRCSWVTCFLGKQLEWSLWKENERRKLQHWFGVQQSWYYSSPCWLRMDWIGNTESPPCSVCRVWGSEIWTCGSLGLRGGFLAGAPFPPLARTNQDCKVSNNRKV